MKDFDIMKYLIYINLSVIYCFMFEEMEGVMIRFLKILINSSFIFCLKWEFEIDR